MEPDNYEQTSGRRDRLENKYAELMPLGTLAAWETAVQLAGIHDALIRLEAVIRMDRRAASEARRVSDSGVWLM